MNFSASLLARLAQAPGQHAAAAAAHSSPDIRRPPRKRRRLDSASGDESSIGPVAARLPPPLPPTQPVVAPPPPLLPPAHNIWAGRGGGGAANDDDDGGDDDGGDNTTDETRQAVFTSLEAAANTAIDQQIDDMIKNRGRRHNCFFCAMVVRYENEVRRCGGSEQESILIEGAFGYKLAIDYHNNNPQLTVLQKAEGLHEIYERHVYNPSVEASGGRAPPDLPVPSLRDMIEHLLRYNFDPVSMNMTALLNTQNLIAAYKHKMLIDGLVSDQAGRGMVSATELFSRLLDKQIKFMGGKVVTPFALDPQKLMALTGTRPLDAFRSQAANILGGATATNSNDALASIAARRPNFGAPDTPTPARATAANDDDDNEGAEEEEEEGLNIDGPSV